ncbi:MAG: peptidoglycan editing factor PgeF [Parvibaculaceae bacterium]
MLQSSKLAGNERIAHGFFTREGGVSGGIYAGRNCGLGSDDLRTHVEENRGRVADDLGVERTHLLTVHQIHSPDVVTVTGPWAPSANPQADAMVTSRPGIALGILTADCVPVLFADAEAGVIGAAHAGWKGALGGVLNATLDAMTALGATRGTITAAIGPAISQTNYEVGPEFKDRFIETDTGWAGYFIPSARDGFYQFDLIAFVADSLANEKLAEVDRLNVCTYADANRFFSFRRTTHAGEPDYGRQMSAIALK